MSVIKPIVEFDTQINADCVQWCPKYENILLCATYKLSKSRKKIGSLLLFDYTEKKLTLKQVITNLPGIFDAKWKITSNNEVLVSTVDSLGFITIYHYNSDEINLSKKAEYKLESSEENSAVYIDWSPFSDNEFLVSCSDGHVSLLNITNNCDITCNHQWNAHAFEAWVASYDVNRPNIFYTGGDDSIMNCFDTKSKNRLWKSSYPHSAGITSFLTTNDHLNAFGSGSYDGYLKLWDIRKFNGSIPITEVNTTGGVWRVKYCYNSKIILIACMSSGYRIYSLNDSAKDFKLLNVFRDDEKQLAYGVDWTCDNTFAGCTFYDHKLNICQVI